LKLLFLTLPYKNKAEAESSINLTKTHVQRSTGAAVLNISAIDRSTDGAICSVCTSALSQGNFNLLLLTFSDTFRTLYPEKSDCSWWSYRFRSREKNAVWRIDYFLVSRRLQKKAADSLIYDQVFGSDHCPVGLELMI